ncbi:hypothetical protein LguiB_029177 [Lonicera macranthoides]
MRRALLSLRNGILVKKLRSSKDHQTRISATTSAAISQRTRPTAGFGDHKYCNPTMPEKKGVEVVGKFRREIIVGSRFLSPQKGRLLWRFKGVHIFFL